jgi:hypothetical protein
MAASAPGLPSADLLAVVADVLAPRHFFCPGNSLEWASPQIEEAPWEIFQDRLLDGTYTRQRRSFLAWNLFWVEEAGRSGEPILAVKLDAEAGQIHVIRGLNCHVWEGYDAGGNVYLSREVTRWVRELIGTVSLAEVAGDEDLRGELTDLLRQAVAGVSRLPLTSLESPLPAFSLGQLAYVPNPADGPGPMRSVRELLTRGWAAEGPPSQNVKVLEAALRGSSFAELEEAALTLRAPTIPPLLRALFNEVALSPWTGFVDNVLAFVQRTLAAVDEVDFLGSLLRQLGRHLTAYDLVTFHHRGANYPDALLLDAVLKRFLVLTHTHPELFLVAGEDAPAVQDRKRLRRRALRQGWLLRRHYEGLPVPDAPTSPGENARVLPAPHVRVPEEQILQIGKRTRRLFAGDPLHLGDQTRAILEEAVRDLHYPLEVRELGMAVFIDRPLGVFKGPAEPDRTLLFSHEAFSPSVARARLASLKETSPRIPEVVGLPLSAVQCEDRRLVSLADVRRAAADYLLLRTTRQSVADFLRQYDPSPLARRFPLDFLSPESPALIVPLPCPPGSDARILAVFDARLRKRLEMGWNRAQGYEVRGGMEYPRGGLQVLRLWEAVAEGESLREQDLAGAAITLGPGQPPS